MLMLMYRKPYQYAYYHVDSAMRMRSLHVACTAFWLAKPSLLGHTLQLMHLDPYLSCCLAMSLGVYATLLVILLELESK